MPNDFAPASPPSCAPRERDDAGAADARIARAEQRLAMLRELSDLGMAMTRRLARRALETPDAGAADPPAPAQAAGPTADARPAPSAAPGPRHDPADSFAKLSRAIRLTVALETRTDDDLAALRAGGIGAAARVPLERPDHEVGDGQDADEAQDYDEDEDDDVVGHEPPPRDYGSAHRNRIRDRLFDVINAEITDGRRAHEVLDALHEGLIEGERYDAVVFGPVREAVEAVCDDLGLRPDWSRWTGEDWGPPPPDALRHRWQDAWAPGWPRSVRRQQ